MEASQWAEWVEVTEAAAASASEATGGAATKAAADQCPEALAQLGPDGLEAVWSAVVRAMGNGLNLSGGVRRAESRKLDVFLSTCHSHSRSASIEIAEKRLAERNPYCHRYAYRGLVKGSGQTASDHPLCYIFVPTSIALRLRHQGGT